MRPNYGGSVGNAMSWTERQDSQPKGSTSGSGGTSPDGTRSWTHMMFRAYDANRNIVIADNQRGGKTTKGGVHSQATIATNQAASGYYREDWNEGSMGNVTHASGQAFTFTLKTNNSGDNMQGGGGGKTQNRTFNGQSFFNWSTTMASTSISWVAVEFIDSAITMATSSGVTFSNSQLKVGGDGNNSLHTLTGVAANSAYGNVVYYDVADFLVGSGVALTATASLSGKTGTLQNVLGSGYSSFTDFHIKFISTAEDTVLNAAKAKLAEYTAAKSSFETAKTDLAAAELAYASATEGFDAAAAVVEAFNAAYAAGEFATYEEALAAWEVAQAAWSEASGILSAAQTAYETANGLFTTAQTAYNTANAAYGKWSTTGVVNPTDAYNAYAINKFNASAAAAGSLGSWDVSGVDAPGLVLAALGEVNEDDFVTPLPPTPPAAETPEPATLLILGLGLAGLGLARRRR